MKTMIKIAIIVIVASIALMNETCQKTRLCKDEVLSWKKQAYMGNQIKTNGYYFGDVDTAGISPSANVYYLFRDGVYLNEGSVKLVNAQKGTIYVDIPNSLAKQTQYVWGIFRISHSLIEIDRWHYSLSCIKRIYEKGNILNDSMFVITYRENHYNGELTSTETPFSTFYFRPLEQKPDSINKYVQ
jgi:hypothetical protein